MAEPGLFGIPFSEEVGGQGGDLLSLCLCSRARAVRRRSRSRSRPPSGSRRTRSTATGRLNRRNAGRADGAGRGDRRCSRSRNREEARREGDPHHREARRRRVVIDVSKAFITNSGMPITPAILVAALDEGAGEGAVSTIVVPADTSGLTVGLSEGRVAARERHARASFDGCRVLPRISRRTRPWLRRVFETLADGRGSRSPRSPSACRAAVRGERPLRGEREAFGRPDRRSRRCSSRSPT